MRIRINTKAFLVVIIFILLLLLGGGVFFLYTNFLKPTDATKVPYEADVTEYVVDKSDSGDSALINNPIDFRTLQKRNSEVVAWISVPDTNIDYPILRSLSRDDFYLHHDIDGDYLYAGSIYMEYCNAPEFDDRVTVLYGHNMMDGSMFANLHKFEDKSFFDKHDRFYIYTPGHKLTYEVASAYIYDDRHIMNTFNFDNDKEFKEYLSSVENPRSTNYNVRSSPNHKLTVDDKIVTLSTCLDVGDGRYLLQGVLIKDELTR